MGELKRFVKKHTVDRFFNNRFYYYSNKLNPINYFYKIKQAAKWKVYKMFFMVFSIYFSFKYMKGYIENYPSSSSNKANLEIIKALQKQNSELIKQNQDLVANQKKKNTRI